MRIAIVFNPRSGKRSAAYTVGTVVAALASHQHELEVIDCAVQPDFERELRDRASDFDRVIVIGGDGTLNAAVNAIASSTHPTLPLAFVPTGRGKDTARSLPSWQAGEMSEGAFELASAVPTDLIKITLASGVIRYSINITSVGLGASAAKVANSVPRVFGTLSYVAGAARNLVPPRTFTTTLQIDDQQVTIEKALLIAACNGKTFGGGIYLAPLAEQNDGLFDVVVVQGADLRDLALQLGKLKSGKPFDHPALLRWRAERLELDPLPGYLSEVDGEMLSSQPIRYDIAPAALNWITP